MVNQLGKLTAAVIILLLPILIFISYEDTHLNTLVSEDLNAPKEKSPSLLLNTTNCKIPDLDPFNSEVLPFVKLEKYEACSAKPLLSYIETRDGIVTLKINESVIPLYSTLGINCCYSNILRKDGDRSVSHTPCQRFDKAIRITYPYVRVTCSNLFGILYRNVHASIMPEDFKNRISAENAGTKSPLKIFMLGIDSISRLNLQRTMPKVFSYAENNFVSFRGYNKMDDNTFPNLMAILTGRNMDTLYPICMRNTTFDDCDIIWKTYRENGMLTAYGEDEPFLNTFNYLKEGFIEPPTDVYLRPYFLSAYLLPMVYKHLMGVCSGPENTAERILNAAKDFITFFKNDSTFALYWLNSFSHDDVNFPSSMDDKMLEFLTDLDVNDSLNDSVIIFFSDHGFRFGNIRFTYSGWLEERLPFLYFKFPKTFQESHSQLYENLLINARVRLTTPYDVHMTLQHLLKLFNQSYVIKPSLGCPSCKSLFEKIEENRSCSDGGIAQHWCTCEGYNSISNKNERAQKIGKYVVDQLNQLTQSFSEGYKCAKYQLGSVEAIGRSEKKTGMKNSNFEAYLILVKTSPFAMFEATVKVENGNFSLLGDISRLNRYGPYTGCINNDRLRKYCFCNSWFAKFLNVICSLFNCSVL